ncbi:MAG: 1-deoxy-D-xylulose-5-phosphate reductoisomerase [Candidatus Midichloria sp.]|uniref:1-deoxy-D-xylulose 5-phosphate reductoisomerase, apicoplastic n=1 Tax=Hyalomma marginatum TaxID=34627 RepID=A0A8S4C1W0_9ACAR|nr:1-deoxy-D-xylulose-5-phosphate reductoisomerase [Hyalomma marginatum]CAG7592526.1 1-deoxy-D-xylulose-5-phosphate reductoisomerase [Hyalomma marginatum]
MPKEVLILGSTGSIGESTLRVIDQHSDKFKVKTLIARSNIDKLVKQARQYLPQNVAISDKTGYKLLKEMLSNLPSINVISGEEAVNDLLKEQYDITVAAIVGMACLQPIIKVIPNTKVLCLANKESIVCAGSLLMDFARKHNTKIIPVDSEHSAIFQVFEKENTKKINRVILTASGGPFLNKSIEEMRTAKPSDAVAHPTWSMGAKISVDSATLMNKGLELIEAHYLFDIEHSKLEAVIHPQSLVHGFIEYADGSMLAQMSLPDMCTSISLALNYPERLDIKHQKITWEKLSSVQFFTPDETKFKCLKLAKDALKSGQGRCIQLNMANEMAVNAFLNNSLPFLKIPEIIEEMLNKLPNTLITTIEDVFLVAQEVSATAEALLTKL